MRNLPVNRRGVLKTGALIGALGLGTTAASAAPPNNGGGGPGNGKAINWEDADNDGLLEPSAGGITGIDVVDVRTDSLNGGVTGDTDLKNLLGDGLTISSSALTADLGSALSFDGDGKIALQPGTVDHDSLSGIDSDDHHTRPSAGDGLTDDSDTFNIEPADFAGNGLEDGGSDDLGVASGGIGSDELAADTVTVAGNSVSLGGSTGVSHGDLDGIGPDDHHAKDHDHTGSGVSAVPNGGLANDSVSVAGNPVSLGGSTGIAHGDLDGIGSDDHHSRPSAGNALAENSNTFDVQESDIDHNNLTNSGQSDAHHARPSAGDGLTDDSNTFNIEPADFAGNGLEDGGSDDLSVASGGIGSDELAADTVTVAGNPVSLGGSTGIAHGDLNGIGSDDHHTRPSAGNALAENSNTFDVQESDIDHNNLTNSGQSDAHHARPSAGDGLTDDAGTFEADLNQVGSGTGVLGGVGADGVDYRSLSGSDGVSVSENGGTVDVGVTGTETDTASTFTESDLSLSNSDTTVSDGAVKLAQGGGTASLPGDLGNYDLDGGAGVKINPNADITTIEATVSDQTSGESRVYITDTNGNVLTSESSPGSGNSVTLSYPLSSGVSYYVLVDDNGSTYTIGYNDPSLPVTSTSVDITSGVTYGGVEPSNGLAYGFSEISVPPVTTGTATAEWSQPSSVSRWETATFQADQDGETVEVYVEVNDGSGWSDWGTNPIGPGTDLSAIPPGSRVRLRAELSRDDTANNPRVTLMSRQYRPS